MSENPTAGPAAAPAAAGHPAERAALVDLDAVAHNVRTLRERLTRPDGTRALLTAVVKADAYGHGAVPVARAALAAGADRLGVAHVTEALALRAAGVDAEIRAAENLREWNPAGRIVRQSGVANTRTLGQPRRRGSSYGQLAGS